MVRHTLKRGNAERLRQYWTVGKGRAKIGWGAPGDFNRCVNQLSKYMTRSQAKGYCANLHHRALGVWPGQEHGGRKGRSKRRR